MPDQLWEMHSNVGNRAVSAFLDGARPTMQRQLIQRLPDPPPVWNMPFELGQATTHQQAIQGLLGIVIRLGNLEPLMGEAEGEGSDPEARQMLSDYHSEARGYGHQFEQEGPLTQWEASNLNGFGQEVQQFHDTHLSRARRRLEQSIRPLAEISPQDTTQLEADLAEELHYAFIDGSPDRIATVREALDQIKEYNERVQQVASWGARISGQIRMANTAAVLSSIARGSESVGELLGRVNHVLTAARAISTIVGAGPRAGGETQDAINQFEQALEVVDVAMSFADAIPLIGTLWSQYYYPVAQACIRTLRVIARERDRDVRDLAHLDWEQARIQGVAPRIPAGNDRFFPGGQPVLDFMFALMTGGTPEVTPAVEGFFLQHLELFNSGRGTGAELEATGSTWYNPLSWLEEDHIPDLAGWVLRHRSHVWAMLYGNIPAPG
jgi:hypothetical protein